MKTLPAYLLLCLTTFALLPACQEQPAQNKLLAEDEGSFLVYRRQSLVGEEQFSIQHSEEQIIVKSNQTENERGRLSGVVAELKLDQDYAPLSYTNYRLANNDTTNVLTVEVLTDEVNIWEKHFEKQTLARPEAFFPLHSNIPAAMELALYQILLQDGHPQKLQTLPRGEISLTITGEDVVNLDGREVVLKRLVIEGVNWGGRTVWVDENNKLIGLVKANTQIRELIRKGYEEVMPTIIAGNVEEQMAALQTYTAKHQQKKPGTLALVGADIFNGLTAELQKDMVVLIKDELITAIGKQGDVTLPEGTQVIDVSGKTLIPGLWDMHAHANQVQWAPAYLAGGITAIRDNGNEIEFATAFRDAIKKETALGPEIFLAGMTDGPGAKGNGVIRARSPEEAVEVVNMYHQHGYDQIKIYNSIEPEILKIISAEAHKLNMPVVGHVPALVGNSVRAVESGMDLLTHRGAILTVLYPDKVLNYRSLYLLDNPVNQDQIDAAIEFLLEHGTVLDPTIALDVVRNLPYGTVVETVEPGAERIAYELFEGKRFRRGLTPERAARGKSNYLQAMAILGQFHKAGIPLVAGTDNVIPVFSLYLEIESYHKLGGLSTLEALQTATIVPARVMGVADRTGSIEVGKEADIAILSANPLENIENIRTVEAVLSNGFYYDSKPLWQAADFKPRQP